MTDTMQDSNLVNHARRELKILGAADDDIEDLVSVVQAFANIGPSGSQAAWLISLLPPLLQFKNLTPLTDNPDEWIEVGAEVWQNARCSEAFSGDGGHTYTLLSERDGNRLVIPVHKSAMQKKDPADG